MTRDQIIAQLEQEYRLRREENLRVHEQREREACARVPELRGLLDARHMALMDGMRQAIGGKGSDQSALPARMARFNQQIAETLATGGFPRDYLQPVQQCAECRDEGYVYDPSRRMCPCMQRELNRRMLDSLGFQDNASFDQFNAELFSDVPDERGVSPRQIALVVCERCRAYAEAFPQTESRDLLLMGKSGLGKTFLLQAIARRVAERGVMPSYVSAYRMFEVGRQAYIENDSARLSPLMNAPLLLIDDLGTEPLMNNITVTQLFNLLNERASAGRHTVISTNLTMSELRDRYTERVTSRLLDATTCARMTLMGDDVRRHLKREGKA